MLTFKRTLLLPALIEYTRAENSMVLEAKKKKKVIERFENCLNTKKQIV